MRWTLAIGLSLALLPAHARSETISTLPDWNGSQSLLGFGETNTATFGQTITVGAETRLQSFSFRIRTENLFGPHPSRFGGHVMQWDETLDRAVGPVLYDSGLLVLPFNDDGVYQAVTINPGIALTSGNQYVLFLSTSTYQDSTLDQTRWGLVRNVDAYSGGKSVYLNNGTDTSAWTSGPWDSGFTAPGSDFAFTATLTPVPEPSSITLMLGAATICGLCYGVRYTLSQRAMSIIAERNELT
ncbi:hypothetical protein EP7_002474 [Isosphaeraceae bacterium EP7]